MATVLSPEVDDYQMSTDDKTSVLVCIGNVEVSLWIDEGVVTVASGTAEEFNAGQAHIHKHTVTE